MYTIPVEVSARHIHLSAKDYDVLFGSKKIRVAHPISQPGQFVATKRVTLKGPKGLIRRVAIIGPFRKYSQCEISVTDARALGISPPLSDSGILTKAAAVKIVGGKGTIRRSAAIIPRRHLHCDPASAKKMHVIDRARITVRIAGPRAAQLENVLVRVHKDFQLRLHLDTDEGNACGFYPGMKALYTTK